MCGVRWEGAGYLLTAGEAGPVGSMRAAEGLVGVVGGGGRMGGLTAVDLVERKPPHGLAGCEVGEFQGEFVG